MSSSQQLSSNSLSEAAAPIDFVHACYFPSWSAKYSPPSSMNLNIITHVFYAFARVTEYGLIGHVDEEADLQTLIDGIQGRIPACIALKDRYSVKILISIGGDQDNGSIAKMASSDIDRRCFAHSVRVFIDKYGFDGVDLNWENIDNITDGQNYVLLLEMLRKYLRDKHVLVSAITAGEWSLRNIDVMEASRSLDFINLMCYDFAGPWSEKSGHHAQLYTSMAVSVQTSCESVVKYLLNKQIQSSKIVMGIPVYGRLFEGADGPGQQASGHCQQIYRCLPCLCRDAVKSHDKKLGVAVCICKLHGFVSYDTPDTVTMKAQYASSNKLGGLFYWTGIYDAPPGPESLMTAGYNVMLAASVNDSNLEAVTAAGSSPVTEKATVEVSL